MKSVIIFMKVTLLTGLTLLMLACAGKTVVESDLGISGAPDWVNEGTQYLNNKDGRLFHGVGQAPLLSDTSLQISTADNRARAAVARILASYLYVASSDYTSSSGTGKEAVDQQTLSREINNLSKINLSGVRIIGHWKDPKDGTIYSIAELDMEYMKKSLSSIQEMQEGLGLYLGEHAENIFDKVATEKNK
ncbi:MAG: LPP20 family lipoprotein [Gammaproteobacteria bacterium]|nr:LPP20 family lipoprotein [Gammaproteobacteria bacterium]